MVMTGSNWGNGILEHHGDLAAAVGPEVGLGQANNVAPGKIDAARGNAAVATRQQADQRAAGNRFPGAAFADEAQNLPRFDAERNVVNGAQTAGGHMKIDGEMADGQQGHR